MHEQSQRSIQNSSDIELIIISVPVETFFERPISKHDDS